MFLSLATGGVAKPVTDLFNDAHQPQWSPDGKNIIFFGYRDGGYDLWEVNADGNNQHMVTEGTFDDREPIFSHDGSKIAFSSDRGNPLGSDNNIWVMDVKSGQLTQLTTNPAEDVMPAWSSDDKEIIFTSSRDTYKTLWAVNVATKAERKIATSDGNIAAASMGPDGQLVYESSVGNDSQLNFNGKAISGNEVAFPFPPQLGFKKMSSFIPRTARSSAVPWAAASRTFPSRLRACQITATAQHPMSARSAISTPRPRGKRWASSGRSYRRMRNPSPLWRWAISGWCPRPAANRRI